MKKFLWGLLRQPVKFSKDGAIKCYQIWMLFRNFVKSWEVPELKLSALENESKVPCFPRWISKICYVVSHPKISLLTNKRLKIIPKSSENEGGDMSRLWKLVGSQGHGICSVITHPEALSALLLWWFGWVTWSPAELPTTKPGTALRRFNL